MREQTAIKSTTKTKCLCGCGAGVSQPAKGRKRKFYTDKCRKRYHRSTARAFRDKNAPGVKALGWGCGLQSTTLLEMSISGDLPKLDVAFFADTGYEHQYTYEVFDYWKPRAEAAGITVVKISGQDIYGDSFGKVSLPLFVEDTGRQIRRKCTRDYKIRPIQSAARKYLGVNPVGRLAPGLIEQWLGITTDEWHRAKDSQVAYIVNKHPLLDLGMSRTDCEDWLRARGLPVPKKSGCIFCPYQRVVEWIRLHEDEPNEFARVINLENSINGRGVVKIEGRPREVFFNAAGPLAYAISGQNTPEQDGQAINAECDGGGYCNS